MTRSLLLAFVLAAVGCTPQINHAQRDRQVRNCWALYVPQGSAATNEETRAVQRCLVSKYDWDYDSTLTPVLDRAIEARAMRR